MIQKKKASPMPEQRPLIVPTREEARNGWDGARLEAYIASTTGGRNSYGFCLEQRWRCAQRYNDAIEALRQFKHDADLDSLAAQKELKALEQIVDAAKEDVARAAALLAAAGEPETKEPVPAIGLNFSR